MTRAKKQTLFNPNPTPMVFDGEGRVVAGGERVEVDRVGEVAQEAIDHGLLVLEKADKEDLPEHAMVPADDEASTVKASGASAPKKPA
jgi:hypothetical protein